MNNAKVLPVLSVRALGSAGNLFVLMVVARHVGPQYVGQLSSALAAAFLFGVVFSFGLNKVALAKLPGLNSENGDYENELKKINSLRICFLLFSLSVSALVICFFPIGQWQVIVAGLFVGQSLIMGDLLKSIGRPVSGLVIEVVALPYLIIVQVVAPTFLPVNVDQFDPSQAVFFAAMCVFICGLVWEVVRLRVNILVAWRRAKWSESKLYFLENFKAIKNYWASNIMLVAAGRIPLVVAPFVCNASEVTVLALIITIASLGGTVVHAAQSFFAPRFSKAIKLRRPEKLAREFYISRVLCSLLFLPVTVFAIVWSVEFFTYFGVEHKEQFFLLVIAMLSQQLRMLSGCSEALISVYSKGGREVYMNLFAITMMICAFAAEPWVGGVKVVIYGYAASLVLRAWMGQYFYSSILKEVKADRLCQDK